MLIVLVLPNMEDLNLLIVLDKHSIQSVYGMLLSPLEFARRRVKVKKLHTCLKIQVFVENNARKPFQYKSSSSSCVTSASVFSMEGRRRLFVFYVAFWLVFGL